MIYTEQTYKGYPVKILGSFDNGNISIEITRNTSIEQYTIKPHELVPYKREINSSLFLNKEELMNWFINMLTKYKHGVLPIDDLIEVLAGFYLNCAVDNPTNALLGDLHNELMTHRIIQDYKLSTNYYSKED